MLVIAASLNTLTCTYYKVTNLRKKNNKGSQPGVHTITGRKMSVHEHDTIHS